MAKKWMKRTTRVDLFVGTKKVESLTQIEWANKSKKVSHRVHRKSELDKLPATKRSHFIEYFK